MKKLGLILLASLTFMSTAAFGITIDGNLSDWGVAPGSQWWIPGMPSVQTGNAGSPLVGISNGISYWIEDAVGASGYVEPGYGGQVFDIEALYAKLEGGILYFAASVGDFAQNGEWNGGNQYFMGDIGLNFGGFYTYGLATTTHNGFGQGNLYSTSAWTNATSFALSSPVRIMGGSQVSDPGIKFIYTEYYPDHWTIEAAIPLNLIGNQVPDNIHITQTCGNDQGNVPGPPVPEPATMFLLGSGLLGLAGFARKKFSKK